MGPIVFLFKFLGWVFWGGGGVGYSVSLNVQSTMSSLEPKEKEHESTRFEVASLAFDNI